MSGDTDAVSAALSHLPDYLGWHVLLSLSAIAIGVGVSLPLAIICARSRPLRGVALGFAGIVQTIPSLALLALFYPLLLGLSTLTRIHFGIGFRALGFLPALAALTLYSMLPVLRNTIAGLQGVDPAVKRAAEGVGMTRGQMLFLAELPLAAPVILAGIRIAAVWVIGTATLSTPVGQTSLGNYIFAGLQTENWVFVLFGCGAAAALALVVDRLLALAESGLTGRSKLRIAAAVLGLVVIFGAAILPLAAGAESRPVVVGTKNFEEQFILGALIEDRLRAAGYSPTRRDGLGSTVIFDALAADEIDVYVDYSGTIWTNEMKRRDRPGRRAVLAQMTDWLWRVHGIRCIGPLGFENAYAFAMRPERAAALGIHSLADLAPAAPNLRIGGDYEIFSRPEWRAVEQTYRVKFGTERQFQSNFLYRAVASGDVDVISAFSSDGRIAQYGLKLLADPKGALPPYDAVLLVSPSRARDANFIAALKPLTGTIDLAHMQRANLMADREAGKLSPEEIAAGLNTAVADRGPRRFRN